MVERTFIAVKPDAVQRGLIGRIITRIEEKGYKIIALKMLEVTPEQAAAHYAEHRESRSTTDWSDSSHPHPSSQWSSRERTR